MNSINIGIIGIGNCASALIQGIEYYKNNSNNNGLLHPFLAGFHISDIKIVAAVDISKKKISKDIAEAIYENDLNVIVDIKENLNIPVVMGTVLDGVIDETSERINPANQKPINMVDYFKSTGTEIVLCLLPSGADKAVKFYAEEALRAGCGFINATPTNIANNEDFAERYKNAGLPLIGDDLQDQFGATILHKIILLQMLNRGIKIKESYALDVGGGSESLNTIYRSREVKREIKSNSVAGALNIEAPIIAGTSDWVPFLGNKRNSMLWIVGKGFLGSEVIMDIKIQTEDGPNGGSILVDVIRATKIALNQGLSGPINEISAYGFKKPPKTFKNPEVAIRNLANFILGMKSGE
ncbi:MAG: inositol-3-phosphate synthase [Promethearchaeota archaeon]